jgi:hypothetical protein
LSWSFHDGGQRRCRVSDPGAASLFKNRSSAAKSKQIQRV